MKKILLILAAVAVCAAAVLLLLHEPAQPLQVYAADGSLLAQLDEAAITDPAAWPEGCRAYLDIALTEAAQLLAENDTEEARARLATGGYRLYTAYDGTVQAALAAAYEGCGKSDLEMGSAVTDLQGHLVAAFSSHPDQNYATAQTPPYSSFKPLSVYAPALEAGLIHFSSAIEDSPVTQVEGKPWPANSSGSCSGKSVPVAQAVQQSLNTVAVRCMAQLGLDNSFRFLETAFDLELTGEKARADALGGTEVYGNIALGHLDYGVTPVQMAGFYQCFGNGGSYAPPKAVTRLCDRRDKAVYTYDPESRQVLTQTNAAIMNRLLQKVTAPGGTGAAAAIDGIPTAGKTGTGKLGNWFVGLTPGYSCAVWHGKQLDKNNAAAIFAQAVSGFPANGDSFPQPEGLTEMIYCSESGMLAKSGCPYTGVGIFASDRELPICNIHN